jgi:hypothetical protein
LYSEYLTKEAVEGFGGFKIGHVIRTVKYVDDLVLAKEEMGLQGMSGRILETVSRVGMEMNVEETKVIRISRHPPPVQIVIDQRQRGNAEYFKYLDSM